MKAIELQLHVYGNTKYPTKIFKEKGADRTTAV